jgi:Glu-tRNA(Gln) amidotransferase subunit E-like FAD-binding protein
MKQILLTASLLSFCWMSFAQKAEGNSVKLLDAKDGVLFNSESKAVLNSSSGSTSQYNLPPGAVLYPKTDPSIDYSEKLYGESNYKQIVIVNQQFKSVMTPENYADMQANDLASYNYYKEAEAYFDQLSDKVKALFTANEIWYIYYFDTNLKNQLLSVK